MEWLGLMVLQASLLARETVIHEELRVLLPALRLVERLTVRVVSRNVQRDADGAKRPSVAFNFGQQLCRHALPTIGLMREEVVEYENPLQRDR